MPPEAMSFKTLELTFKLHMFIKIRLEESTIKLWNNTAYMSPQKSNYSLKSENLIAFNIVIFNCYL